MLCLHFLATITQLWVLLIIHSQHHSHTYHSFTVARPNQTLGLFVLYTNQWLPLSSVFCVCVCVCVLYFLLYFFVIVPFRIIENHRVVLAL